MYDKTNIKRGCLICNELKLKAICLDRQKTRKFSKKAPEIIAYPNDINILQTRYISVIQMGLYNSFFFV